MKLLEYLTLILRQILNAWVWAFSTESKSEILRDSSKETFKWIALTLGPRIHSYFREYILKYY